ncbi:uncharacterized protein LOC110941430 isoform X2 [Helianthus annuus]|nr:uncharacterized protein LOC110941430 isoform X2 [Helianthus annuus]
MEEMDFEVDIPEQPQRKRRARPPPDPLENHPYLEFPLESEAALRCEKLRKMHIGEHFAVSWKTLRKLEVEDWVRGFVPVDSPWDRLFELSFTPTYREILVEFLSSFEFHPRRPNEVVDPAQPPPPPEVSFRMAGQAREMSLAQFAVHSGLYTEAEIATDLYTKGLVMIDKPTLLGFWDLIADIRHWDHHQSKGRSTLIEDPLFRYLHKMISTSITARNKSREWCTSGDLFFLYCLLYKRPCALAYGLAQYFASAHHRQERGMLFGGAYVTKIAHSLGYHPENDRGRVGPAAQPKQMGMNTINGMHITKDFPCGKRLKNLDGTQYQLKELPEEFPLIYPPRDPEPPEPHDPAAVLPRPPQPRGPPGAPQFPRHVMPGPDPSHERLLRNVERNNYLLEWVAAALQQQRQHDGLPPLPFIADADWDQHQRQQQQHQEQQQQHQEQQQQHQEQQQ